MHSLSDDSKHILFKGHYQVVHCILYMYMYIHVHTYSCIDSSAGLIVKAGFHPKKPNLPQKRTCVLVYVHVYVYYIIRVYYT